MDRDGVRQWVNLLTFVLTIVVNGLANALPLNNQTTGEISDRFEVYFVPASYVFSIWGLIYLALLGFVIYQILPAQRRNPRLRAIGYWFALANLANGAWIFLWHYEYFAMTLAAMLTLLVSLIVIYLHLDIGRVQTAGAERWLVDLPFSIYLGWVTVATIANATSLLDFLRWGGWGIPPQIWAVIMLCAGVLIAVAMAWNRGDIAYLLVIIWAFVGIAVKQAGAPLVSITAWVCAGLVFILVLLTAFRRIRPQPG